MNQEEKHATLKQSKKLKELGVVLETEKYWYTACGVYYDLRLKEHVLLDSEYDTEAIPAPDAAELSTILVPHLQQEYCGLTVYKNESGYYQAVIIDLFDKPFEITCTSEEHEHIPHALMDMLISRVENKHLKPEGINL